MSSEEQPSKQAAISERKDQSAASQKADIEEMDTVAEKRAIRVSIDKEVSDRIANWLSAAASVATGIAVVVALFAYQSDRLAEKQRHEDDAAQARRAASLAQVDRFGSNEILAARTRILTGLMLVGTDQLNDIEPDPETLHALTRAMGEATGDPIEYDIALFTITDFYDGAEACLAANVCDLEILKTQIGPYGAKFHCFFAPVISRLENDFRMDGFGQGVFAWAQRIDVCGNPPD
ncbi:hypothetical protein [uncultured Hoeflea sp.]|uniref:hypothetical protein n=1 Tax=uncultured Hoeflea sp. TaxID=538666 RepID=UPI0030ECEDAE|tara:strand:- start:150463 stop:151167 length:705 start_codon:yes stop_codon:yes gene_type:complete